MKLDLTINGAEHRIEVLAPAPAARFRFSGGPDRTAEVERAEPGVYSVLMDGRSYDARVEETPDRLIVVIDGWRFEIEVRDPRRRSRAARGRRGEGIEKVAAAMPGKVVRLLAAPGDEIQAGQGLMVIEAMKMQNELKSPRAGRIASISAREGATVAAGEILAVIE